MTPIDASTPITMFSVAISRLALNYSGIYFLMLSQKNPAATTWRPAMVVNAEA